MSSDIPLTNPVVTPRDIEAVTDMLRRGRLADNHMRGLLEQAAADMMEVEHTLALASSTEALRLVLDAMGVGQGSEVVLPALGQRAWVEAAVGLGATPRFVDVDPRTQLPDPQALDASIGEQTRVILIGANDAGMEGMLEAAAVCQRHEVPMVELVGCHVGSRCGTATAGSIGRAAIIDLSPASLISSGAGGLIATSDASIATTCRQHVSQARAEYLSEPAAAMGLSQWHRIEETIERCRHVAETYTLHLSGIPELMLPSPGDAATPVWSRLVVRLDETFSQDDRDEIIRGMERHDIETGTGMVDLAAIDPTSAASDCPMAHSLAGRSLALPMHAGLSKRDVELICQTLRLMVQRVTFRRSEDQ